MRHTGGKRGKQERPYNAGEANPVAKLTEEQVAEIRARTGKRGFIVRMAEEFGVSHSAISLVRNAKTWRHLG